MSGIDMTAKTPRSFQAISNDVLSIKGQLEDHLRRLHMIKSNLVEANNQAEKAETEPHESPSMSIREELDESLDSIFLMLDRISSVTNGIGESIGREC